MGQGRVAWAPRREPPVPGGTAQRQPRILSGREDGAVGGEHNGLWRPHRRGRSSQLWPGPCPLHCLLFHHPGPLAGVTVEAGPRSPARV